MHKASSGAGNRTAIEHSPIPVPFIYFIQTCLSHFARLQIITDLISYYNGNFLLDLVVLAKYLKKKTF